MSSFKVNFPGNKKVDVVFENFKIKTDQSVKNGGDETAPEPFTLFLSSLAACAGIYAKSFCDTRNISADNMQLILDVSSKKGQAHMEEIRIHLHVDSNFPKKYIKPIIKAMESCAVKNQLHPDIRTDTSVIYPDQG